MLPSSTRSSGQPNLMRKSNPNPGAPFSPHTTTSYRNMISIQPMINYICASCLSSATRENPMSRCSRVLSIYLRKSEYRLNSMLMKRRCWKVQRTTTRKRSRRLSRTQQGDLVERLSTPFTMQRMKAPEQFAPAQIRDPQFHDCTTVNKRSTMRDLRQEQQRDRRKRRTQIYPPRKGMPCERREEG